MLITQFLDYLKSELRYSEHTLKSYQKDLESFQHFLLESEGDLPLSKVETQHIRNFIMNLNKEGHKASSINRKLSAIKRFYKYLIQKGKLEINPASTLKNLKKKKEVHLPFSIEEMDSLPKWEDIDSDNFTEIQVYLLIELLYLTGIRRAELINLKESDFLNAKDAIKVVGKRNKERMIPISKDFLKKMKNFIHLKNKEGINSEYAFCLKNGKKLYPKFVYNIVNKYFSTFTTKEKKSPHMLRHTFATHLLNNKAEINSVKELLGHSSLASTQVYTHQDIETLKEVFKENHPRESK